MENQKFQYAKGRFINSSKIIEASIYEKQVPGKDNPSAYETIIRVAITLDVQNKDKGVVYSDAFSSVSEAELYVSKLPIN